MIVIYSVIKASSSMSWHFYTETKKVIHIINPSPKSPFYDFDI